MLVLKKLSINMYTLSKSGKKYVCHHVNQENTGKVRKILTHGKEEDRRQEII